MPANIDTLMKYTENEAILFNQVQQPRELVLDVDNVRFVKLKRKK